MALSYKWYSYQGTATKNNRDYCGIAKRSDSTLYIVTDGATRGTSGDKLAKELTHSLVDRILKYEDRIDMKYICNQLQKLHKELRYRYPADSTSYLVLLDRHDGKIRTAHAGDCRLGKLRHDKSIEWLTKPHCLANALTDLCETELVKHDNRHQLTRSFRPKQFQVPEYGQFTFLPDDVLFIATDGFWAEMNVLEQAEFLDGRYARSRSARDDRSCLSLRETAQKSKINDGQILENIYIP